MPAYEGEWVAAAMLEGPAEALRTQAENNRATFDALAEQSRRQRGALENLIWETTNAYMNVLQAPFSYYQEVMEAMTAPGRAPGMAPKAGRAINCRWQTTIR